MLYHNKPPNPTFKRDALPFTSHKRWGRKDQSLWKVSSVDSGCIDPHTAKFSSVWIIHAGGTCPGGPETVLVHHTSCITHIVIQQDSCLASDGVNNQLGEARALTGGTLVQVLRAVSFIPTALQRALHLKNGIKNDPAVSFRPSVQHPCSTEVHASYSQINWVLFPFICNKQMTALICIYVVLWQSISILVHE